jgi:DNA-binding response OmpR family regulator
MTQPCILIVEPQILIRGPLADYLRECGYHVLEAVDTAEATQILNTGMHRIDIVLADIDRSHQSGFALASSLRRTQPDIHIVLAGTVAKATQRAAELCEEGSQITKPYDHQVVLDHIKRLLAARDRNRSSN